MKALRRYWHKFWMEYHAHIAVNAISITVRLKHVQKGLEHSAKLLAQ